jgi:succinoglycan biosynthesis protein ExoM
MKIVVTLCTRERPRQLIECLNSLFEQQLPPGVLLTLVIIENDTRDYMRKMVEDLANRRGSIPVIHAHEPRLGIPIARNRALAVALEHNPDWIGFIDDDEVAAPDWIKCFVAAATTVPCDVLQGPVEYRYPASTPSAMLYPVRKHKPTGGILRTAATSNTFMRAHIARSDGLGIRFNEAMRFTGGSDSEYFYRAADLGARIHWMNEAVVYEDMPVNRTTLAWQLERSWRVAANAVFIQKNRLGMITTIAKCGPKYASRILGGAIAAPFAAALLFVAPERGGRMLYSALCDLSSGLGGLGAFFSFQPEPYRVVDKPMTRSPTLLRRRLAARSATTALTTPGALTIRARSRATISNTGASISGTGGHLGS